MMRLPLEILSICVLIAAPLAAADDSDSSSVAAAPARSKNADEEGFVPLFNGQDLSGWEGNLELWKVADGMIVGDSPGINHNDFLATEKTYSDFELRLEFRLKDGVGNSGIQFRSRREENSTAVIGYQADIGQQYWGCLYDEHRRRKVLAVAPPELEKALHKDGWNTYIIRARGPKIEQFINGLQTVDYTEEDPSIERSGIIALQVHSGGPLRIEFRNIRIRELTK